MEKMHTMTNESTQNLIKILPFRDIVLWDVKRYASERIKSDYPIVKLGLHIQEESHKVKLFDFPEEEFGILGVNNKIGIFDAYKEKGANIHQAYKRMEIGWLAYNPYRVNVGSIGMRTEKHRHEFISPAYVVFSCKETLLPDFLYKLFKTERFNKIINESTTGSVRQNLTFDILKSLDIALPSVILQESLLKEYFRKFVIAEQNEEKIIEIKKEIENYFFYSLGVEKQDNLPFNKGLNFIKFKSISRWAISFINNLKSYNLDNVYFDVVSLKNVISMFEGGKTPSTSNKAYWDGAICWISPKDFHSTELIDSEDKITESAVGDGMKVYPAGTILCVFRSGILRHSFPVAVTQMPTAINQDLKAMEVRQEIINKDYFVIYLQLFQKMILELASKVGVTVESINSDEFLNVPIVLPPLIVQNEIIGRIKQLQDEIQILQVEVEKHRTEAIKEFEHAIFKL
jgi:type I restriction enzyme, S subunit